jgi:lipopolysaccharide exporter
VQELSGPRERLDPPPLRGLARRAVRGVFWTVSTSIGARALGLAGTLLLTRFLDPGEYGEVSLAAVVIATAGVASSCGLSQYIVSRPGAGRAAVFHATLYYTVLGLVALALAVIAGGPIGDFIHAPGMVRFLPGLAFAAVLERVGTVQDRILVRDMRFRDVGLLRSLGEVVYTVASIGLAAAGAGTAWGGGNAVVWASIARSLVRLVALSAVTPRREWLEPCPITWARTRDLFAFGLPMSLATLAGFGSRRWDNLVFSRSFGQAAAGIYNLAYNLADIPASQLGETIGDVLVPSFAKIEGGPARRRALLVSLRQMTLLCAPLAFGLGALAPTVTQSFFDRRWAAIDVELALLSVLSAVRPIGWIGASYLQVENRPRTILVLESVKTLAVVGLIPLSAALAPRFGAGAGAGERWACASVGVAFGLGALSYRYTFKKLDGIPLCAALAELLPPVLACVPMVAVVLVAQRWLSATGLPGSARLIALIALGAAAFVPSAFVIAPAASREFLRLCAGAVARRGGE